MKISLRQILISSFILHPSSFPKLVSIQIYHFYGRHGGLESFVVESRARSVVCLLDIVCRNDTKEQWYTGAQTDIINSASGFASHVFKVRCLATNDHAETNHRVKSSRLRGFQRT